MFFFLWGTHGRVDGLYSAIVTDRDGVVLLKATAPDCPLPFTESALGCTFALASDQASKLGLKKNKSIVGVFEGYQLVQFNHSPLITTFVASSEANTGRGTRSMQDYMAGACLDVGSPSKLAIAYCSNWDMIWRV
ncbi:Ragulator complex protein lamtor3 [Actinomortierella ambigua]|nr:Ragulator complex protein lamtor3 [Actinomortierella ambigua]